MGIYRFLLTRRLWYQLIFLFFGLLLSTLLETISFGSIIAFIGIITDPQFIAQKININIIKDFLLSSNQEKIVLYSSISLFVIFLVRNVFLGLINFFTRKFIFNIVTYNSKKLFNYYLDSPLIFHYEKKPEVISRNLENLLFGVCERLFYFLTITREALVMVVVFIAVLYFNTITSTVVFLVLMIFSYIFIRALKNSLKKRSLKAHEDDVSRLKIINEFYFNLKEIKLYNIESTISKNYLKALYGVESHRVFVNTFNALPRLFLELIAITGILFLSVYSTLNAIPGDNLISTITIIAICATRLIPGFQQISTAINVLNNTKFAIKLISNDIKNFNKDISFTKQNIDNFIFEKLSINNLSFSYRENLNVLEGINLKINKSDKICIFGESGSGKTTLMTIMMGLLNQTSGEIYLNNEKINKINLFNYQNQIGYVAQDIFLIDDSIINNIAIGLNNKEIDMNLINKVLQITNLKDFINSLPEGLETKVGTKGTKLSGGQQQRIGIARALYRSPKILFFDEATSSLDDENESKIMKNIFHYYKDSTIISITHKSSLKKYFEKILYIEKGKIVSV